MKRLDLEQIKQDDLFLMKLDDFMLWEESITREERERVMEIISKFRESEFY